MMTGFVGVGLGLALQIAAGATVEDILPGLVANGQRYMAALPSLSCEETAVSQRVKDGKVKEEVRLVGVLQIQRTGDERRPFEERYQWRTRDGEAVADGKKVKAPYFVQGAFANGLGFSSGRRVACFDMALKDEGAALVMTLRRKDDVSGLGSCEEVPRGLSSRLVIERGSGHVTRVERSVPADEAKRRKEPYFAAIDYAPVRLGEEMFWLPMRGEMRDAKDEGRMQVEYTGCKRFAGSMKIVGGVEVVPGP